jgi:hypothetical protein
MMLNFQEHFNRIAESSSVKSKDKAVFYSGEGNQQRAIDYAQKTGAVPIDHTPAGKQLNGIYNKAFEYYGNKLLGNKATDAVMNKVSERYGNRRLGNKAADAVMDKVSERFAKNARGHVNTFVIGAKPERIFRTTELPALLNNSKVKSINGVDRNDLKKLHDRDPNRAFDQICRAELVRDIKEARNKKDQKLLADVKKRMETYHKSKPANDNRPPTPKEPKKLNKTGDAASRRAALRRDRNRLSKGDRSKSQPTQDLLNARLKLNKAVDRKNQLTPKERFKAQYGKPKDTKKNLGKSLREKPKASPKSKDSPLAKNKTPNPSKEPRVALTAESSGAKKTGGTKEKKASLRNGYQKRDKALKTSRDKKAAKPNSNRENVKSRYGKQSDSNRTQKAETRKSSDSRQAKSSSTPKTDTKSKPSGDTKPSGGGGTSRRR